MNLGEITIFMEKFCYFLFIDLYQVHLFVNKWGKVFKSRYGCYQCFDPKKDYKIPKGNSVDLMNHLFSGYRRAGKEEFIKYCTEQGLDCGSMENQK